MKNLSDNLPSLVCHTCESRYPSLPIPRHTKVSNNILKQALIGTYIADECYGIDTLFIRADFTYLHHFVSQDGVLCLQDGLWEYEDQYIGFWNFHLEDEPNLLEKHTSVWGVKPERCLFGIGKVCMPLTYKQNCYYREM